MSSKKIGLSGCVFLYVLIFLTTDLLGQWKKIPTPSLTIGLVYFQYSQGHPEIGFLGSWIEDNNGFRDIPAQLWKTQDSGKSWHNVADPSWQGAVRNIFFMDAMNGWAAIGHMAQNAQIFDGGLYRTKDGGETWAFINGTSGFCTSVYYNSLKNLLFTSFWGQSALVSGDDGATWKTIPGTQSAIGNGGGTNGFSFWDSMHGLITKVGTSLGQFGPFLITSDGGYTWQLINLEEGAWQSLSISGANLGFILGEEDIPPTNRLYRTNDFGLSWDEINTVNQGQKVSGCIMGDAQKIFIQSDNGLYISIDSGKSFYSLCGPSTYYDTRFQFVNNTLIAYNLYENPAENHIWINTTGIGSNSTPQLSSISKSFNGLGCNPIFDSLITFTFFDSCNGIQAKLVSASLQGSNNFSFISPSAIPRTIHPDDSLLISYNPNSPSADTASLHLRFHLGWKDFDTTIMLTGVGRIPKENVQFIPSISANAVSAGSSVDILIKPNKLISGKALQSISFDLNYFGDLLDYQGPNAGAGYTVIIGTPKHNGKVEVLPVTITGNDLSLDPNSAIADLKFMAMVTDTTSTPITISNLKLNGGDVDYQNCILSADTSATNFTEVYLCGDSTLSKYLRTGNILSITSIHPNPAQDEVEIELHSAIKQDVKLEVFDALGARVFSQMKNISTGANTIHIDTKGFSVGVYLVKVGGVSWSLVISK